MKKIALICCGDESYFSTPPYAPLVALTSFRKNFGDEVDYFCVGRFSDESTLQLIEHNEFRPLNIDLSSIFNREHKSFWGNFPPEGFYLGKIPSLFLERGYDYCVVTDGDVYSNKRFDIEGLIEDADMSGVRQHPDYEINTGVLLLNNKRCVEKNFFEEFVRLYEASNYWSEQPLVNDLVDTRGFIFRELDITYNFTLRARHLIDKSENREQILEANTDDVKIAHFESGKPWLDLRNTQFNFAHFLSGKPWLDLRNIHINFAHFLRGKSLRGHRNSNFDYPIRNYFAQLYQSVNIKTLNNSIDVSVVIPTYNRKELLKDTIESLFDQTYPQDRYEIIVVDDGSSDRTEELVNLLMEDSPCHLRYFKQKNQGPAAARNLGINVAEGEIIGFTDDDCTASPDWVETAATYFKNYPEIVGLAGRTTPTEKPKEGLFKKGKTIYATGKQGPYPTCNIFYTKQALEKIKGFDSNFRVAWFEDYDLTLRILKKGYKIDYSEDLTVKHAVAYISYFSHLKSLKKNEYAALYFKKHPELKKKLALGFITNKKHIYPIFTLLALLSLLMSNYLFAGLLFLAALLSYSWGYVFKDGNIKKYPLRFISFPTRILPDTVRMYFTLRGAVKYRCLVL